jgi:hypothetical protein
MVRSAHSYKRHAPSRSSSGRIHVRATQVELERLIIRMAKRAA